MKIKSGFVVREIAGDYIVVATGEISKTFHAMIKLNDSGKDIWDILSEGASQQELYDKLCAKHGLPLEEIKPSTDEFVEVLRKNDLFEA